MMFGTQARLALAAGYSQNAITHALKVGRTSPALAMAIHKATYGRVSKHDLAPEIFGPRQTQRRRKMQSAAE